jgi:hypothetical protein
MRRLNPLLVAWLHTWGTCENRKIGLEYPGITPEARLLHSPGRCGCSGNKGPFYEPNATSVMVGNAIRRMENREHALLLIYRFVEQRSYGEIAKDVGAKNKEAAVWLVEKAIREVASVLGVPTYM